MKKLHLISAILIAAIMSQGCASTKARKVSKNKLKIPRPAQSYALMDEEIRTDPEVVRRGNKARGTDEY